MVSRARMVFAVLAAAVSALSLCAIGCGGVSSAGAGGGSTASATATTGAGGSGGGGGSSTGAATGGGGSSTGTAAGGGGSGAGGSGPGEPTEIFFYQFVGMGQNAVRMSVTFDGLAVGSGATMLSWAQGPNVTDTYGDPVMSHLPGERFAMTAWTGPNDSRGAFRLLYREGGCPMVSGGDVHVIGPASGPSCQPAPNLMMGKGSQVFAAEGGLYLFLMNGGRIFLAHLEDAAHPANALASICLRKQKAQSLADLAAGEATEVLGPNEAGDLLLSDTAIARRADGTWVLFVKGMVPQAGCGGGNMCELCSRKIYRTTSADLLTFTPLEAVVSKASIPEAVTGLDGKVELYFQDFSETCAASDLMKAMRAPISTVRENDDHSLTAPAHVTFPNEAFESNPALHYATNGNPVILPDQAAFDALVSCLSQ